MTRAFNKVRRSGEREGLSRGHRSADTSAGGHTSRGETRALDDPQRTVVLLYSLVEPDFPSVRTRLPLPLAPLAVARPLLGAGYKVEVVDQNVDPRPLDRLAAMPPPLFVGISCMGGYQITSAMALARKVAHLWPDVPRVWGGWNPTLLPELYEADDVAPIVDVVVRGRGEVPVLEIARRLEQGRDLDGIDGVSWRDECGAMQRNPDAPWYETPSRPALAYELLGNPDDYITGAGVLNYISSYGCPHRCSFCGIPAGTQTFRPLPNEHVVEDLVQASERGMHTIEFFDDNFFTDKRRALDLAQRLIEAGVELEWNTNARVDQFSKLSDDELALLVRSGYRRVNLGYETGDQQVADGVRKDIDLGEMDGLAERCRRAGIHISLNLMVGLPGEDTASLVRSLESLWRVHSIQPETSIAWYMFMPAPATPLWRQFAEQGLLTLPTTLAEHTQYQDLYLAHPWYYVSPARRVFRERRTKHKQIVWWYYIGWVAAEPHLAALKSLHRLRQRWGRWRFSGRHFALPLDWWAFTLADRLRWRWRWMLAALYRTRPLARWNLNRIRKG